MPIAGPSNAPLLRSGARAGSIIVWIGGPITTGSGASDNAHRMSSIASHDLGLAEKNYAAANVTVANGLVTRTEAARDDKTYDHNQVAYVILTGGLQDNIADLSTIIAKAASVTKTCKTSYPNARIIWAAGPGSLAGMNTTQLADTTTIVSAILGQARANGALAVNMRTVLGTDTGLQSSGILPNNAGHEALARAIVEAVEDDRAEPVDTPITPTRTYSSGLNDWASRQVEATRKREAEKREANRPTGTELGGVTEKLDELTQAQGVQQVLLDQAQNELKKQQDQLTKQQMALKAAQDELAKHQQTLQSQQNALKAAQDQLAKQQTQLSAIVGEQGNQVTNLQQVVAEVNAIQNNITAYLGTDFSYFKDLQRRVLSHADDIRDIKNKLGM